MAMLGSFGFVGQELASRAASCHPGHSSTAKKRSEEQSGKSELEFLESPFSKQPNSEQCCAWTEECMSAGGRGYIRLAWLTADPVSPWRLLEVYSSQFQWDVLFCIM